MNIEEIERMENGLNLASKSGMDIEFEALQDITTAWSLRFHVVGNTTDLQELYQWYINRLITLQEKVQKETRRLQDLGPNYHLKLRDMVWQMNATMARIRAVLDSLPEVARGA